MLHLQLGIQIKQGWQFLYYCQNANVKKLFFQLYFAFFPHVLHVYSHSKMFSEKFFLFYKHGIYLQFILQYTKNAILIWPYFQQLLLHKSNHVLRLNAWFYHIFCKKISQTIEPEPLKSHF